MKDRSYPESGRILYGLIEENIKEHRKVNICLEGVTSLPSMLLNESIGRFIEENGYDDLKGKVSFSQLSSTQADRIRDYIEKFKK